MPFPDRSTSTSNVGHLEKEMSSRDHGAEFLSIRRSGSLHCNLSIASQLRPAVGWVARSAAGVSAELSCRPLSSLVNYLLDPIVSGVTKSPSGSSLGRVAKFGRILLTFQNVSFNIVSRFSSPNLIRDVFPRHTRHFHDAKRPQ